MALTTTTAWAMRILTEKLAARALPASSQPKVGVYSAHVNKVSLDGFPSKVYKFHNETLTDVAATIAEGTEYTTVSDLTYSSNTSVTPADFAHRVDITAQALMRRIPGATADQVYSAMQSLDVNMLGSLLVDEMARQIEAHQRAVETALLALFSGFSGSSSPSSNGTLTLANFLGGIFTLESNDAPNEQLAAFLAQIQVRDLRAALLAGSGASLAQVLSGPADVSMVNYLPDEARSGLKGSLFGVPVFQCSQSLMATANATVDVVGAIVRRGEGDPEQAGARIGASIYVEGHGPQWSLGYSASKRELQMVAMSQFAVAETIDTYGCKFVSGAAD